MPGIGKYIRSQGNRKLKLLNGEAIVNRRLKEDLRKKDHLLRLEKCRAKAPMIAEVETRVGWCKLWDRTLEFGVHMQGGCRQSAGLWLTMASVPSPALCAKLVTCRYPSITTYWTFINTSSDSLIRTQ